MKQCDRLTLCYSLVCGQTPTGVEASFIMNKTRQDCGSYAMKDEQRVRRRIHTGRSSHSWLFFISRDGCVRSNLGMGNPGMALWRWKPNVTNQMLTSTRTERGRVWWFLRLFPVPFFNNSVVHIIHIEGPCCISVPFKLICSFFYNHRRNSRLL